MIGEVVVFGGGDFRMEGVELWGGIDVSRNVGGFLPDGWSRETSEIVWMVVTLLRRRKNLLIGSFWTPERMALCSSRK